ncbi:MAG: FkbM family methyltransferase, partial [Bacteroidia bacterium]|nr:FkbM family methyltransferase [Bacteroidia bacterium]
MQKIWTFLFDTGRNLDLYFKKRKKEKDWQNWLKIFKSTNTMDFNLSEKLKIRLYKDSILSKCIYQGFEQIEIEFICKYLKQGDVFFDIGSNMGLFSLYASELVGNMGKIYAFEPTKGIYKRLIENIELNGIKNIVPVNKGISDKNGTLALNISDNGHDAWNSFAKISDEYYKSTE